MTRKRGGVGDLNAGRTQLASWMRYISAARDPLVIAPHSLRPCAVGLSMIGRRVDGPGAAALVSATLTNGSSYALRRGKPLNRALGPWGSGASPPAAYQSFVVAGEACTAPMTCSTRH
jgi:hypothetical protein